MGEEDVRTVGPEEVDRQQLEGNILNVVDYNGSYSFMPNGEVDPQAQRHLEVIAKTLSYFPDLAESLIAGQNLVRQHSRQGQAGIWYRYDEGGHSVSIESQYYCAHRLHDLLYLVDEFRHTGKTSDNLGKSFLSFESRTPLVTTIRKIFERKESSDIRIKEAPLTMEERLLAVYGITDHEIQYILGYDDAMTGIEKTKLRARALEEEADKLKRQASADIGELQKKYSENPE